MNISKTSASIAIIFYLKQHWRRENAALGFGPDQIRTLVSMATYSFKGLNGGNVVATLAH